MVPSRARVRGDATVGFKISYMIEVLLWLFSIRVHNREGPMSPGGTIINVRTVLYIWFECSASILSCVIGILFRYIWSRYTLDGRY